MYVYFIEKNKFIEKNLFKFEILNFEVLKKV